MRNQLLPTFLSALALSGCSPINEKPSHKVIEAIRACTVNNVFSYTNTIHHLDGERTEEKTSLEMSGKNSSLILKKEFNDRSYTWVDNNGNNIPEKLWHPLISVIKQDGKPNKEVIGTSLKRIEGTDINDNKQDIIDQYQKELAKMMALCETSQT